MTTSFCAIEEDLRSLLPLGFKAFHEEMERKKEQCPLPDLARSDLWLRRGRRDSDAKLAQGCTEVRQSGAGVSLCLKLTC
mmetsp:Transcript_12646/g.35002  ORF Transcript_12646/g.35002 Transcript_12646/m.35002 type:complete len:80 (+) Transcript_12646:38-277(+)